MLLKSLCVALGPLNARIDCMIMSFRYLLATVLAGLAAFSTYLSHAAITSESDGVRVSHADTQCLAGPKAQDDIVFLSCGGFF